MLESSFARERAQIRERKEEEEEEEEEPRKSRGGAKMRTPQGVWQLKPRMVARDE